nr:MAG TPA: Protein of unknown function (DUF1150) [Caudoviricetes sp.]
MKHPVKQFVDVGKRSYVKTTFPNGRVRYSVNRADGKPFTLSADRYKAMIDKIEKELKNEAYRKTS